MNSSEEILFYAGDEIGRNAGSPVPKVSRLDTLPYTQIRMQELSGFLTQRLCETESENIKFSLGSGNQNHDPATLHTMISNVQR